MKNILMNVEMTKAILDGRKVQFREAVEVENGNIHNPTKKDYFNFTKLLGGCIGISKLIHPIYQIGETIRFIEEVKFPISNVNGSCLFVDVKITNVRVEKLQAMTLPDMQEEGCPYGSEIGFHPTRISLVQNWWIDLWNKTALKGYKWQDNPYVFVYEFKRVENEN